MSLEYVVPVPAWKHVRVVVPNVLISRRLVVLSSRYTVTSVRVLEREGDEASQRCKSTGNVVGQYVDVLEVGVWNDQNVARVIHSPFRSNEGSDELIPVDDIVLNRVGGRSFSADRDHAERTNVVRRLMGIGHCH